MGQEGVCKRQHSRNAKAVSHPPNLSWLCNSSVDPLQQPPPMEENLYNDARHLQVSNITGCISALEKCFVLSM